MEKEKPLHIFLLGSPRVSWKGYPLDIARRQVRGLLYRLAADESPLARDVLAHLFWPDVPNDRARDKLSRLLHLLQKALPDPTLLLKQGDCITLDRERIWTDAQALAAARTARDGETLRRAATLYRGPFLDGFALPASPPFEEWMTRERYYWERRYLSLLTTLIDVAEREERYEEAIRWAQRYLEIDELAEPIHRRLILLYAKIGERNAALAQYERCVVVLERELGIRPLPETRAAYEAVRRGTPFLLPQRPSPPPPPPIAPDLPFVGRDDALHALRWSLAQVRTGHGRVVLLSGEMGSGKTRLVREFLASHPDLLVVSLTGSPTQRNVPYAALRAALQALPVNDTLRRFIDRGLRDILFAPEAGSPARVYQGLSALFHGLATAYPPLILFADNLQELDQSTFTWLQHWLPQVDLLPLLFIGTYRSEYAPLLIPLREILAQRQRLTEIVLEGLSPSDIETLVRRVLPWVQDPHTFGVELHRLTGGNPLFLTEVIRWLQEERTAGPDLAHMPLPATVQDAVQRRLAPLSPRGRHVLEAAAVLDSPIPFPVLVQTSGYQEEDVLEGLEELVRRGVLRERGTTYEFVHEIVRETVYRRMLHARRRMLHRRAAIALRHLTPDRPALIAHHLQQAGEWSQAVSFWLRAGDKARQMYAYREAVYHYERALALQRDLGDEEGAANTLMRLGLVYHIAFDFAEARRVYDESFRLWRHIFPTASVAPVPRAPLRVDWPHCLTLDPACSRDENSGGVIEFLFRGLVEWDPALNVVPDGAWAWEALEDGRQYVFHLREDMVWSDGRPVSARDFVTGWLRVLHPSNRNPLARILFPIRNAQAYHRGDEADPRKVGIQAVDDLTLLVTLERPCSFFPHLVAHPITRPVPTHVVEREGERWWFPEHVVTNGAFRLERWTWGEELVLRRFEEYVGRWPGNVEEVILYLGSHPRGRQRKWKAFREEALDVFLPLWGLPQDQIQRICRLYGDQVFTHPNFFVRFVGFDVRRPPFDDVRVRRAFAHSINRRWSIPAMFGLHFTPAVGGLIPPEMPGHSPDIGLEYDPARARALLAEAGYPEGRGFPEVTFQVFPGAAAAARVLQRAWERVLNVPVVLSVVPWEQYVQHRASGPHPHIFLGGWVADYPDPDSFLRVSALFEWTGWEHPRYTALVEEALARKNQEERMALYREADRLLVREAPILPLVYSRWVLLLQRRVRTFPFSPLKWWFWKDVILRD